MNAVPLKFVDSIVELFGKNTLKRLARKVRHRVWKDVLDLHRRNRVYYTVYFSRKEDGIRHVFFFNNGREADLSINMRTIRGKGRFARIVSVTDSTTDRNLSYFDEVEVLGEAETTKLLETVAPLIDPASEVGGLSNHYYVMRCYTCECDKFEKRQLKNDYPELHDF
uniref:F-box domain-containing protein n=1 Tax=Steinernema glaseri TaxID=37863 RepID=A0A1I7Y613_9BILA